MSRKKFISYPAPSTNVPEKQMHSRASYSFSQTSLLLNIFILTFSSTFIFLLFSSIRAKSRTHSDFCDAANHSPIVISRLPI